MNRSRFYSAIFGIGSERRFGIRPKWHRGVAPSRPSALVFWWWRLLKVCFAYYLLLVMMMMMSFLGCRHYGKVWLEVLYCLFIGGLTGVLKS